MVHINSKYVHEFNGELDHDYLAKPDGIAVLGFLFHINGSMVYKKRTDKYFYCCIITFNIITIHNNIF